MKKVKYRLIDNKRPDAWKSLKYLDHYFYSFMDTIAFVRNNNCFFKETVFLKQESESGGSVEEWDNI